MGPAKQQFAPILANLFDFLRLPYVAYFLMQSGALPKRFAKNKWDSPDNLQNSTQEIKRPATEKSSKLRQMRAKLFEVNTVDAAGVKCVLFAR